MKKIFLKTFILLGLLTSFVACSNSSSQQTSEKNTTVGSLYEGNNSIGANEKYFFSIPSYTMDYKGGVLPVNLILNVGKNVNPFDITIVFKRYTSGISQDFWFGTILKDLTHNGVFIVKGDVYIPFNKEGNLTHEITVSTLINGIDNIVSAFVVNQNEFVPEVLKYDLKIDMTNANGGYTINQDENGSVHIVQLTYYAKKCISQGWLWDVDSSICLPPEDSLEFNRTISCINSSSRPNKWDFVTGGCYNEISPDLGSLDACNTLNAIWLGSENGGTCYSHTEAKKVCSNLQSEENVTDLNCSTVLKD